MQIESLLSEGAILTGLKVKDKFELIGIMTETLKPVVGDENIDSIKKAVEEREIIMSTGVGQGIGLPHCKTSSVLQSHLVFALLDQPIEYGSMDGLPVKMTVLIVSPDPDYGEHIKLLSRVSKLLNKEEFRHLLLEAGTPEEIRNLIQLEERKIYQSL